MMLMLLAEPCRFSIAGAGDHFESSKVRHRNDCPSNAFEAKGGDYYMQRVICDDYAFISTTQRYRQSRPRRAAGHT